MKHYKIILTFKKLFLHQPAKIPEQTIILFIHQLSTMITANIPILQCCQLLLYAQKNPPMRIIIHTIKNDLEAGKGLANALRRFPQVFNELICHLIKIGEMTGTLEETLQQITILLEKSLSIKRQIKQSLFYPGIVLVITLFICLALLIFIVPRFADFFQNYNKPLPLLTRAIITLSLWVREKYYLGCFPILLFLLTYQYYNYSLQYKKNLKKVLLHLPIIKKFVVKIFILRFITNLNTVYTAGINIADALQTIAVIASHPIHQKTIYRIREQVLNGQQLHLAMGYCLLFEPLILQMVKIGETTGTLQTMLNTIERFYTAELDRVILQLNQLLEPLIMLILGVLIGGLIIAMYLPIFRLGMTI